MVEPCVVGDGWDEWVWLSDNGGLFIVKSCYRILENLDPLGIFGRVELHLRYSLFLRPYLPGSRQSQILPREEFWMRIVQNIMYYVVGWKKQPFICFYIVRWFP